MDPASFELWRQRGERRRQGAATRMLQDLRAARQQKVAGMLNLQDYISGAERDDPMVATWKREKRGLAKQLQMLEEKQCELAAQKVRW